MTKKQENTATMIVTQSGQAEAASPGSQLGFIPYAGVRFDSFSSGFGLIYPPTFYTQSDFPPVWSPKSACQREQSPFLMSSSPHFSSEIHSPEQGYQPFHVTTNHPADQTEKKEEKYLEFEEGLRHGSLISGMSANSCLCDGAASSSVHGSICDTVNGNATPAASTVSRSVTDNHIYFFLFH